MTMQDIERLALDGGHRVEKAMVEVLTHEEEPKQATVCGGRMRSKEETITGYGDSGRRDPF